MDTIWIRAFNRLIEAEDFKMYKEDGYLYVQAYDVRYAMHREYSIFEFIEQAYLFIMSETRAKQLLEERIKS